MNIKDFIKTKEFVFLAVVLLLGIIVLVSLIALRTPSQTKVNNVVPTASPDPNQTKVFSGSIVESLTPKSTVALEPNSKQKFVVSFVQAINIENLDISLTALNIIDDSETLEKISYTLTPDKKVLTIETANNIQPYRQYALKIIDKNTGEELINESYLSDKPLGSAVVDNNLALSNYLPYETNSFKLSYSEEKNIYVFNFKFDSESSDSLDQQYDKAKNEAIEFMKSKNVDPNSIVIDWRFS